jgi:predicted nucleic acid-binding protein
MILVDTGPFIALFDPKDPRHESCVATLRTLREPLRTTVPVLTEALHILAPGSRGADNLREFVLRGGVSVFFFDLASLTRAFELMETYADRPMDLADASLVVAAESVRARKVLTVDRPDFETYRIKRGHRYHRFEIVET